MPGAGSLVGRGRDRSGPAPEVAGKPEAADGRVGARPRYGEPVVMIGDRPSTDGAFAAALGWPFALVLSGVAGATGEEPVPDPGPPFVAADLGELSVQLVDAFGRAPG